MIRLHQFAPAFGLLNASPFCMKLEMYLRMAGLPYEAVNSGDVMKAPKRKLPYIDDGGTFTPEHWKLFAVGNVVAFIVALLAIKGFVGFLTKHGFALFGWYRIAVGALLLVLLAMGTNLSMV